MMATAAYVRERARDGAGRTPYPPEAHLLRRLGPVGGVCIPLAYRVPLALGFAYRITRVEHALIRGQIMGRRAALLSEIPIVQDPLDGTMPHPPLFEPIETGVATPSKVRP